MADREISATTTEAIERLKETHPEVVEATRKFLLEMDGKYGATAAMAARALARMALTLGYAYDVIDEKGVLIEQPMQDRSGTVHYAVKDNPLLFHLPKMHEVLGFTAKDQAISKASRGETVKNEQMAALLAARRIALAKADKSRIPLPPKDDEEDANLVETVAVRR